MYRTKYTSRVIVALSVVTTFIVPSMVKDPYWIHLSIMLLLNLSCSLGLWLIVSTGQISIAQAGFMAVGAYTSAILTKAGLPFWPSFFFSGSAAVLVALIIGIPTLRIKGAYFAILTFAFGEVIRLFLYSMPMLGGSDGISGIPQSAVIKLPGLAPIAIVSPESFYIFALLLMWTALFVIYRVSRTHIGIMFRAIADSDILAESLGIDSIYYKLLAFSIGGAFAGLAGSIMAHYLTYIGPDYFSFGISVNFLLFVIIGGMRNVAGPVVGATFLTLIPEILATTMGEYRLIIYGILLIIIILYLPLGLVSIPSRIGSLIIRK